MRRVLITGIGAVIGYGILQALRQGASDLFILGCDINADAVGQAWCDSFHQAPLTESAEYASWILELVRREGVDLIIPAIEQDVLWFSRNRAKFVDLNCGLALCSSETVELGADKYLLYRFLETARDPSLIPTFYQCDFAEVATRCGLPFIAKPRMGYASKGLRLIQNESEFVSAAAANTDLIFQPLVGMPTSEYTASVFSDGSGDVLARITLRRTLALDGSTAKVWSDDFSRLDDDLDRLTRLLRPIGAMNLQFRESDGRFYLLEINPRISSSTMFRLHFGYNEAEMTTQFFLDARLPTQPVIRRGFGTRYLAEAVFLDRVDF